MTLQHVTLETRRADLDGEVAFWELVGFKPVDPPATLRGSSTWVARRGTQIHLLHADEPVTMPRGHVAVVVDDYPAALERLWVAGHAPDPRREHWGAPRAFVRTPAGHLVELMAAPPPG
jgi:catechol 2,3-dioxygenase-like lactoylglutathione lyase family enzyme